MYVCISFCFYVVWAPARADSSVLVARGCRLRLLLHFAFLFVLLLLACSPGYRKEGLDSLIESWCCGVFRSVLDDDDADDDDAADDDDDGGADDDDAEDEDEYIYIYIYIYAACMRKGLIFAMLIARV